MIPSSKKHCGRRMHSIALCVRGKDERPMAALARAPVAHKKVFLVHKFCLRAVDVKKSKAVPNASLIRLDRRRWLLML